MGLFCFIAGIVAVVLGLGFVLMTKATIERTDYYGNPRTQDATTGARIVGGILLLLGVLTLFLDSYTTVEARSVAIQTSFGKVHGNPLGSGWHWVAPWNNIEKFDASVQTLKYYQGEKKDDGDCITVRLANSTGPGSTACVDVTAQWQINYQGDVNNLYLQYKTFDNIHDNLVRRQLGSALNEVFGTYDPLSALGTANDRPTLTTKDLQDLVRVDLQRDLGSAIKVDSVTIPLVHFDGPTEDRLRQYQQAKADTQIATQQALTATEKAKANKALAGEPATNDPGVQYQNCLDVTRDLAKLGQLQNLPLTWNCNKDGSSAPVIVQK